MQATSLSRYINHLSSDEKLKALELLQVRCAVQQLKGQPIPTELVKYAVAKLQGQSASVPQGYKPHPQHRNGKVEVKYATEL